MKYLLSDVVVTTFLLLSFSMNKTRVWLFPRPKLSRKQGQSWYWWKSVMQSRSKKLWLGNIRMNLNDLGNWTKVSTLSWVCKIPGIGLRVCKGWFFSCREQWEEVPFNIVLALMLRFGIFNSPQTIFSVAAALWDSSGVCSAEFTVINFHLNAGKSY